MAKRTDGSKRLALWLKNRRITQAALADLVGVEQATVSRWVTGAGRPESPFRDAIASITGVEATSWLTPRERALVERVAALPATGTEGR